MRRDDEVGRVSVGGVIPGGPSPRPPPPNPLPQGEAGLLLNVIEVRKTFGGLQALQGVSLAVPQRRVVGLIGPNGSGKSTLFDIITGFQRSDSGQVLYRGERIEQLSPDRIALRGLIRTFQMSEGGQRMTTTENLLAAVPGQQEHRPVHTLFNLPAAFSRGREIRARAREVIGMLGLKQVADEYVGNLSGGQRKLLDLGRIFMARPRLSLLDEPTAGVNPRLIDVIVEALRRMNQDEGITLLIVEHNMRVIQEFCDYVYVLDAGRMICDGTPEQVSADARVLDSYLGRTRIEID
jgi:ABC-type branched-subunit amino acid transport system ATPase component